MALYAQSLALLTDLYQLTMACGYRRSGMAEREAVFHLSYRHEPFGGAFALACGLATAVEYLESWRFSTGDLDYLAGLAGADGAPLFDDGFLAYLGDLRFACDIDAAPEGSAVFAHEPLVRVRGPLAQCQLLETPLLNIINYQSLIATKAARVAGAAGGDPVIEFGLRRAHGIDGGLSASRAAYIGGCAATSNVLAGRLHGVPVRGTHAHSWVMCFDSELESFEAYAEALPNNCVFLVDTYDTLGGVTNAIAVGRRLRERGFEMIGIRLDSGDLAHLSIEARRMLDEAGFPDAAIVASNDLDENIIASLKQQGARIALWGVGTKLATAHDQPALGGVYKIAALAGDDGRWHFKVKLSEQPIKISTPGIMQVRRRYREGEMIGDVIYCEEIGCPDEPAIRDLQDPLRVRELPRGDRDEDLLVPIYRRGELVAPVPPVAAARERAAAQLEALGPRSRRLLNPQIYLVGLEERLSQRKRELVAAARAAAGLP
jgi:nicotinate phosphoribosyltransferase